MSDFRRIKIQATVETAVMLLADGQIDGTLQTFCDTLKRLDLAILCVAAKEEAPVEVSVEYQNSAGYVD